MAASSIHKPGWRSRRRSRLSLVERAVPRLGRMSVPDEGAKAARFDEILKPPSPDTRPRTKTTDPTEPRSPVETSASLEPAAPAIDPAADARSTAEADRDDASAGEGPAPMDEANDAPRSLESAGDPTAPAIGLTAVNDGGALSNDGNLQRDDVFVPANSKAVPTAAPAAPPGSAAPAVMAAPSMDVTDAARDAASGRVIETRAGAQPSSTLALDWDRLVEGGFTDPRDRSRPLSKNMDEIIRALVRQALSDQSSWRDRVILVTSPNERDSKTTAAINFALGLTTVGNHQAVLVDVDTSGAGAVDRLGGGDRTGIAHALADESIEIGDLIVGTDLDRLTLVASGTVDEDTLDRFASRRMLQILRHLTENPETILVIDAPPILASQEAAVLSVIAGQVVLAVEAGRTTADQIDHALQRIGDRHNVSLVLNESSGIVVRDGSTAALANGHDPDSAGRRLPLVKRRMPKAVAAVAAGTLALGLFVLQPAGQTGSTGPLAATHAAFSAKTMVPPERLSIKTDTTVTSARQVRR